MDWENEVEEEGESDTVMMLQAILVELVKVSRQHSRGGDFSLAVLLCVGEDMDESAVHLWTKNTLARLKHLTIEVVTEQQLLLTQTSATTTTTSTTTSHEPQADVFVWASLRPLSEAGLASGAIADAASRSLVPGGSLLCLLDTRPDTAQPSPPLCSDAVSGPRRTQDVDLPEDARRSDDGRASPRRLSWWRQQLLAPDSATGRMRITVLRKAPVRINYGAAPYWQREASSTAATDEEKALVDAVTVALTLQERTGSTLSPASHHRAVASLLNHGLVVITGLFSAADVTAYGAAVRSDMAACIHELLTRFNVDLLRPGDGDGSARVDNFHELSMREALRCDLRDCPAMNAAEAAASSSSLRQHPAVLRLLDEAMSPAGPHTEGNWGRWNFEGRREGPSKPPPLAVGHVGAVVTLPGCLDQTIHADTPHLFAHTQLPPHYVNLFLPTVEDADLLAAGQTAFVAGSHRLEESHRMMVAEGGEARIVSQLVRPHLASGDCLLFDTRVLHFGLENSSQLTRATLYVNYHHTWFHDPKNFTKERIFPTPTSPPAAPENVSATVA